MKTPYLAFAVVVFATAILTLLLGATRLEAGEVCYPIGDTMICRDRD